MKNRELLEKMTSGGFRAKLASIGRVVTYASCAVSIVWGALFFYMVWKFVNAPLQPDRATGRVVPWNEHGRYHYISVSDNELFGTLADGVPIIIFVSFVGLFLYKGRQMFGPLRGG